MKIDRSNEYCKYIAEFEEKLKSGKIIDTKGVYSIKDDNNIPHTIIKPSYSEWLLEEILLSLRKS